MNIETDTVLDKRSIYLRKLIVEALEGGGRGHVGSALSLVEILRVLYDDVLNISPEIPTQSPMSNVSRRVYFSFNTFFRSRVWSFPKPSWKSMNEAFPIFLIAIIRPAVEILLVRLCSSEGFSSSVYLNKLIHSSVLWDLLYLAG